ncbi:transcriptional regulator with XRE-family HTH domain [Clostridium tetanomorphum]|uniref:helix-turn-helix domain-containing protein n=1 Tax=Clostridium tetanomorphum TaxID=1553 RepID=UPI0004534DD4|nr:helix-turn-helix transcriptional regulator [Clostridium tetanomorphum]KAJ48689.1 DNA-binding protein [Clostridium tetanomorphum DSM 665]KAJ51081.1 DNA-binding protein [Clostridium tetanomorphum DSM 665]MBP1864492.1 transcriptional regulator with XRE-family HTH domain [Clostridium tetanomorphum]NRS82977.1 transcriptional regulator with XRE-family HTH domain [Clostridium tetanomorphum]SQC01015.1 DNA-binding protein [Clostridium tetanomorphum]
MDELKNKIKNERLKKGLSQPELAKIMNVSKQTISNWENGNRIPDVLTLKKLADFFDVSTDYLLCRTDQPQGIIQKATIDGNEIELELDRTIFPNGLTYKEILEKLEALDKLEKAGFKFNPDTYNE